MLFRRLNTMKEAFDWAGILAKTFFLVVFRASLIFFTCGHFLLSYDRFFFYLNIAQKCTHGLL